MHIKKGENIFYNGSLQVNFPSNAVIDKSNKQRFILDADTVDFESLILRKRKAGDSLCPLGSAQPVSLKEFFIKRKIPLSLRNSHVVLADKNGIIAILGYEIAERVKLIGTSSKYLELVFSTTATQSGLPLNPPHRGGRCKSHPL